MVALRLVALLLLVGSVTLPAHADIFPYEAVGIGGSNNTVDSNASSCDQTGVFPGNPGEGCYTRTGTKCLDNPNQLCDLQIVPAGRCTYGELAGGLASCVWPHRAGHCAGNIKVGCLTSTECSGLSPTTCVLTSDKFGRPADPNDVASCTCTNANETTVCGGSLSVCSDGDPMRAVGGLGVGLGLQLNLGGGQLTFANMGPAITGSSDPNSSPPFALESPPSNFDPQRDAGTIARGPNQGLGPIHQARATDAREIEPYVHPTIANPGPEPLNVRKVTALGDSYWGDWVFISSLVAPPLSAHIVTYPCNAPSSYVTGTPINPAGDYCHEAPFNGIGFLWQDDLTAAQKTAYSIGGVPVCPPHCYKDFNTSTMELQELTETGALDPEAAIQLALQSGEPGAPLRVAGARDSMAASAIISITYLTEIDLRCRLGGWGNAAGFIGRCVDGASACNPAAANCGMGTACCSGQGSSCSACNGPIIVGGPTPNPLGLPIGYNTHGYPQLDLVAGERIGGIAGSSGDVRVPLFVALTSGNATSDFRDIAGEQSSLFDLANMGPAIAGTQVPGIGVGGTFVNGTTLNIDEPCCGTGAGSGNVVWQAGTSPGTVVADQADKFIYRFGPNPGDVFLSDWSLTYDKGAGPDGIPGCIGDNLLVLNGSGSCDNRLGVGVPGAKTNAFYATGLDDRTLMYPVGATSMPASAPRFKWRDADPSVVAFFGLGQNPPTTNTVAAFTLRDLAILNIPRSGDVLVKVNTTQCPLTNAGPQCCDDPDGDFVCATADNCLNVANPIVPGGAAAYVAANPWATLTGGQRDDDHDGYGNACDGDFGNNGSTTAADTAQYKASLGDFKYLDICGTAGNRPCAIFDLNANNSTESSAGGISAADTARYKALLGSAPGPRCSACTGTGSVPAPCVAGTAGTCF